MRNIAAGLVMSLALVAIVGCMVDSDPNEVWAEELQADELGDPELGAQIAELKIKAAEAAGIDVNSLSTKRVPGHAPETIHTKDPITGEDQFTIIINGISVNLPVRQWQADMNGFINFFGGLCGPLLAVDGGFGPRTTAATVCFQNVNGLRADGDVGRITLGAMCADLTTAGRIDLRNNTNCTQ